MVLKKLIKIIFLDHYLFINLFPIFYFYIHNKKINAQVYVEYVSGMRLQPDKWNKIVTRQVELTSYSQISRCVYI